ncbi:M4 family metallopeptidase [Nonomuraea sp. NPDC050404]|uniref:M4 family metallopeptidase n=1 Tax=Nonomuraea sp. NPDC050404 TaxID=3155783 RepID=UPI0033EDE430
MNLRDARCLIVAGVCLAATAAGAPVAVADDEIPAVGHGFHSGTVPLTTVLNGDTYELKDATRGGASGYLDRRNSAGDIVSVPYTDQDNDWGDGTLSNQASQAVDAQYAATKAWDYFANVHGRKGFDGEGRALNLHGRVAGLPLPNGRPAFVPARPDLDSPARIAYASPHQERGKDGNYRQLDGATLDLVGGAFAMGVAHVEAGLPRWEDTADHPEREEPAAIGAATANIFGTMIEFYANNRVDRPDHLIGERLAVGFPAGTFAPPVSMANPSSGCWSTQTRTDPGPANHFFYLLAMGDKPAQGETSPTCNGMPVTGIGNDKAAKIWYRALTEYFAATTNYAAARIATLKAAADLYGAHGLEYNTVNAAWSAVSVNGANPIGGSQTPRPVNPGDQDAVVGKAASLQLEATNPGGRPLTHTAVGLPPGLTIDPASGLISGTPTKKGDYRVTVGVTDTLHAQGTTWFMWYVS